MAGREAKAAEQRLAAALATKWSRPYSWMVQYVRARMAILVVRSMSYCLCGTCDREPARAFVQCGAALHGVQTLQEW